MAATSLSHLEMEDTPPDPGQRYRPGHPLDRLYRAELYVLLSPYLGGAFLLVIVPVFLSLVLAFTQYDTISPPTWSGLQNFRAISADPLLWIALRLSLIHI